MDSDIAEQIQAFRDRVGERFKELRTLRGETLEVIAERVKGKQPDRGKLSRFENGKYNPSLKTLCYWIIVGLRTDLDEFFRPWMLEKEEKERQKQERRVRRLLEKLLTGGPYTREQLIKSLELIDAEDDQTRERTPG